MKIQKKKGSRKFVMKKKSIILALVLIIGIVSGSMSVSAYQIWMSGGFSPTPAYVYCYSGFSSETLAAVHNACLAWNGAGQGNLVFRSTNSHSTITFPYQNNKNEITKGYRGSNTYLMATAATQTSGNSLKEADIDINISHDFGTADTSYDTRTAITHEIGHLLGLDEMYIGTTNVMYYKRAVGDRCHALSTDDKAGIAAIY
ncbi:MAG: matrixin family metalloprotease [Ruminococcaceae bacterium]|nr:matrixin family metalloprotease [Oscillospiraceae bacterium]